jgi:hypothetical protein
MGCVFFVRKNKFSQPLRERTLFSTLKASFAPIDSTISFILSLSQLRFYKVIFRIAVISLVNERISKDILKMNLKIRNKS